MKVKYAIKNICHNEYLYTTICLKGSIIPQDKIKLFDSELEGVEFLREKESPYLYTIEKLVIPDAY